MNRKTTKWLMMAMTPIMALSLASTSVDAKDLSASSNKNSAISRFENKSEDFEFEAADSLDFINVDSCQKVPVATPTEDTQKVIDKLPSAYMSTLKELKAKYPGTKLQTFGTCSAFGVTACAEFSMIAQGYANKNIDYSEMQLGYRSTCGSVDPIGGTKDDYFYYKGTYDELSCAAEKYFHYFNSSYLVRSMAKWDGVTNGTINEFDNLKNLNDQQAAALKNEFIKNDNKAILTGYKRYDVSSNTDAMKAAIKKYGAVEVGICGNPDNVGIKNVQLPNGETVSTFYVKKEDKHPTPDKNGIYHYLGINHSVVIVGWDDHFSKENFVKGPKHDGAWVVRNSYSTTTSASFCSYFYMSYDTALYDEHKNNEAFGLGDTALSIEMKPAYTYQNNYQYDGALEFATLKDEANPSAHVDINLNENTDYKSANVFTVKGEGKCEYEMLQAASFYVHNNANVNYTIEVYTDLTDLTNPTSGTLHEEATTVGKTDFMGYYTVNLAQAVKVKRGSTFSIVITLAKDNKTLIPNPEKTAIVHSDFRSIANLMPGQSFICTNGVWTDWISSSIRPSDVGNIGIKAFTTNIKTVKYLKNAEDATGTMEDELFDLANTYIVPACEYEKEDYIFKGWVTSTKQKNPRIYKAGEKIHLWAKANTTTFYALWEEDPTIVRGSFTDTIQYMISDKNHDGLLDTVKISGTGALSASDVAGFDKTLLTNVTTLIVEEGITELSDSLFANNTSLKTVSLPESLLTIGTNEFLKCLALEEIVLPNTLNTIGSQAFAGCTSLTQISIPTSVREIGGYAFYASINLVINVPYTRNDTFKNINQGRQWNSRIKDTIYVEEVQLNETITYTLTDNDKDGVNDTFTLKGTGALLASDVAGFDKTLLANVTTLIVEEGITELSDSLFENNTSLKTVSLPNGLLTIGEHEFCRCLALEDIVLPNTLNTIGSQAFAGCTSLTQISIPTSVREIGGYAFYASINLVINVPYTRNDTFKNINQGRQWNSRIKDTIYVEAVQQNESSMDLSVVTETIDLSVVTETIDSEAVLSSDSDLLSNIEEQSLESEFTNQ